MPIYEYQCENCGLRFEHLCRNISSGKDTIDCEGCSEKAKRMISTFAFKFNHASGVNGAAPSSTGTSDDWNYDKAIGRDAERKWEAINERNSGKDRVVRDERKSGRVISRNHLAPKMDGTGEYRVISEGERKAVNASRETAMSVSKAVGKKNKSESK
jgi:putative FmdB family regulatory protein